jgi:ribosomal protein S12 methylthiotransferase accessory factor
MVTGSVSRIGVGQYETFANKLYELGDMVIEQADARLQIVAERFRWITRILAPDAPGFVFFGAEVHAADFGLTGYGQSASLSGKGVSEGEAFAGCVGEGIEHLSRLEWGNEPLVRGTFATADHGLDERSLLEIGRLCGYDASRETPELDWMQGCRLSDGSPVLVPACLCIRRPDGKAAAIPSAISTGCAAGPSIEKATLAALLEVVERDAVALWWMGGRRGRTFDLGTLARSGAAELLDRLREGNNSRITWLLNITSDVEVPCVAALSASVEGRGFACGTAARLDVRDAVRAALLELCQSELGHHLVAAKRKIRGDEALNEVDRRKLHRGRDFDARCCDLLYPSGFPEVLVSNPEPPETADGIRTIVERLQRIEVDPLLVELTRPELGVPVVRVVAPGLQPFPSSLTTGRLAQIIAQLGSGATKTVCMSLY